MKNEYEKDKVMAVLIETKLSSSATFEHAIAQVSPFVSSWGGLSSLSLSHLQVIGYYVKFETENAVPPLCFVLSEDSAQLVCFPFTTKDHDKHDAINCLVLPPIPLFLKVNTEETTKLTFYTVNRYLLALILLWTKPDEGVYNEAPAVKRRKLGFADAVKKSLIKAHIQSESEKIRTQLQEALEIAGKQRQELEKERKRAEKQRQELEKERKRAEKQRQELEKERKRAERAEERLSEIHGSKK